MFGLLNSLESILGTAAAAADLFFFPFDLDTVNGVGRIVDDGALFKEKEKAALLFGCFFAKITSSILFSGVLTAVGEVPDLLFRKFKYSTEYGMSHSIPFNISGFNSLITSIESIT